jgi:hypothetical protein
VPSLVTVLLGMSGEVADTIRGLQVADLAHILETRSSWVRPRWADRTDLWLSVLHTRTASHPEPSAQLRLLQATATQSSRMLGAVDSCLVPESLESPADAVESCKLTPVRRARSSGLILRKRS